MGKTFEPMTPKIRTGLAEEVMAFPEGNKLLRSSDNVSLSWHVIHDFEQAKRLAWNTPIGGEEMLWTDIRESVMADVRGATYGNPSLYEMKQSLADRLKYLGVLVRQRLDDRHQELLNDIVGDLFCCALNRSVKGANGFFEQLFNAYQAGGWPCGWDGTFPHGRLIVYFPKQDFANCEKS